MQGGGREDEVQRAASSTTVKDHLGGGRVFAAEDGHSSLDRPKRTVLFGGLSAVGLQSAWPRRSYVSMQDQVCDTVTEMISRSYLRKILPFCPTLPTVK